MEQDEPEGPREGVHGEERDSQPHIGEGEHPDDGAAEPAGHQRAAHHCHGISTERLAMHGGQGEGPLLTAWQGWGHFGAWSMPLLSLVLKRL